MVHKKIFFLVFILLLAVFIIPPKMAAADNTISAADIISSVNGMRVSYGLSPMTVSGALTSCAQWTADTMAAMGAGDHLSHLGYSSPSQRCAGFGFGGGQTVFVTENWAMGHSLPLNTLMYDYWADYWHMLPMTQAQYTYIGIGISDDGSGGTYYVLEAGSGNNGGSASTGSGSSSSTISSTTSSAPDYSQYMIPVVTSTPDATGLVLHKVKYGQALISIALAYGVSLNDLKTLNGLTSDIIYEGDVLKIKQVPTPTPAPTSLATEAAANTPVAATEVSATPAPLMIRTPTALASTNQTLPAFDRQTGGLLMVVLSILGLAVAAFFIFRKPPQG